MKFENVRVYNFSGALRGMRNPKESWHLSDSEFGFYDWDNSYEACLEQAYNYLNFVSDKKNVAEDSAIDPQPIVDYLWKQSALYVDEDVIDMAIIGPKDLTLAQNLIRGGSEHRKFMRQIFVCVDITAPLYWWKEFDTYKVGTVANSTSTMHKITSKPITIDCFEIDDLSKIFKEDDDPEGFAECVKRFIDRLEGLRLEYINLIEQAGDDCIDVYESAELQTKAKEVWKELIRWLPESWLQTRTVTFDYENLLAICSKGQRRFHKLTEWSGDGKDFVHESFIKFARKLPYAKELIFIDEGKDIFNESKGILSK